MNQVMTIEGMADCLRWTEKAPEDMVKLAKKAMRSGGKAVTKAVTPRVDSRWRRLVKYKVTGGRNERDVNCGIGFFNNHDRQGHHNAGSAPVDDWFKAYWANYGTLTRRDPEHRFTKPIKHSSTRAASRRRNDVGQPHLNFFERALEGYEDIFYDAFSEYMAQNIEECYDR